MIDETDSPRDRDLVGRLVRLAEAGAEVPWDGADRVRAAVRPLWQREVRARSRRRRLWVDLAAAAAAILVAAVAAVVLLPGLTRPAAAPVATIDLVHGGVEITPPAGGTRTVADGADRVDLVAGSLLTTPPEGRTALRLVGGQSLRLDRSTSIRLVSAIEVRLESGGVYVDSEAAGGEGVRVGTPVGVVREIGTRFEVRREGGSVLVRVRKGAVELSEDGRAVEVAAGTSLAVARDGEASWSRIAANAPEWLWAQEVAPRFEIEGRRVTAFLEWVSAETGLEVRFRDPAVEAFAAETVLHGSIASLSPHEAPAVVLESCGLAAEIEGPNLVIGRGR